LFLYFVPGHAIKKAQENQKGLDMNGLYWIFIYVYGNLLRGVSNTIRKNKYSGIEEERHWHGSKYS
jgi:hypothetical protein